MEPANERALTIYRIGLTAGIVAPPTLGSASTSCGNVRGIFLTRASTRDMFDASSLSLSVMSCLSEASKAMRIALPTLLVSSVTVPSPPDDSMFVMCADENWERSTR